jgi:hypothetical protein
VFLGNDMVCEDEKVRRMALCLDRFRDRGEIERQGRGAIDWAQGVRYEEHFVLTFNLTIPTIGDLSAEVLSSGYFLAGMPSIASWCNFEDAIALRKMYQLSFVCVSDYESLWRGDDGRLYCPTLYLTDCILGGHRLDYVFYRGTPILATRQWDE